MASKRKTRVTIRVSEEQRELMYATAHRLGMSYTGFATWSAERLYELIERTGVTDPAEIEHLLSSGPRQPDQIDMQRMLDQIEEMELEIEELRERDR